jgi:hypothetical protein
VWVSGCNKRGIEKQTKYIVEGKKESKTQLLVSPTRANVAGEQAGEQRRVPPTPHIQTQVNSTQISNRNPNPIPLRTRNSEPALRPTPNAPPSAVNESRSSERRWRPLRRQPHGRTPRPRLIRFYPRQFHRQEEGAGSRAGDRPLSVSPRLLFLMSFGTV